MRLRHLLWCTKEDLTLPHSKPLDPQDKVETRFYTGKERYLIKLKATAA